MFADFAMFLSRVFQVFTSSKNWTIVSKLSSWQLFTFLVYQDQNKQIMKSCWILDSKLSSWPLFLFLVQLSNYISVPPHPHHPHPPHPPPNHHHLYPKAPALFTFNIRIVFSIFTISHNNCPQFALVQLFNTWGVVAINALVPSLVLHPIVLHPDFFLFVSCKFVQSF